MPHPCCRQATLGHGHGGATKHSQEGSAGSGRGRSVLHPRHYRKIRYLQGHLALRPHLCSGLCCDTTERARWSIDWFDAKTMDCANDTVQKSVCVEAKTPCLRHPPDNRSPASVNVHNRVPCLFLPCEPVISRLACMSLKVALIYTSQALRQCLVPSQSYHGDPLRALVCHFCVVSRLHGT